jgi:hypothetical protein
MWITKQILAFLFCFTRELNLYTPLISILPPTYPPIPHTPHTPPTYPPIPPPTHPTLKIPPSKAWRWSLRSVAAAKMSSSEPSSSEPSSSPSEVFKSQKFHSINWTTKPTLKESITQGFEGRCHHPSPPPPSHQWRVPNPYTNGNAPHSQGRRSQRCEICANRPTDTHHRVYWYSNGYYTL